MRVLLVFLALTAAAWAQDFPVEIELAPPPGATPRWAPPAAPCSLCAELRGPRGCGCDRLLDQAMAERLGAGLQPELRGLGLDLDRALRLRVVSQAELDRLGGEHILGLYSDGTIYLSRDLTRREAVGVLAHEYAHAWQYAHHPSIDQCSALLVEGFAEWVAYRILENLGDRESARTIRYGDDTDYGRGARWFLEQERARGRTEVLRLARSRTRV